MARYRWGFEIEVGGVPTFQECNPLVEDSTSLDYSQQSNEMFYRAKLNGSITFRFSDFDYILNAGYNATHIVVLQHYVESDADWAEIWRGRFVLTDCTIDYDKHNIDVSPETMDRYTAVLDNLEKEYNLIKLSPNTEPVQIQIRPCLQVYLCGANSVSNYVGGNYWETSCDNLTAPADVEAQGLQFEDSAYAAKITWKGGLLSGQTIIYYTNTANTSGYLDGWAFSGGDGYQVTIRYTFSRASGHNGGTFEFYDNNDLLFTAYIEEPGEMAEITIADTTNVDSADAEMFDLRSRTLVQTEMADGEYTIEGVHLYLNTKSANDFAGETKNYNKRIRAYAAVLIISADVSEVPTVWGQNVAGKYFVKPADTPTEHYMPVNQSGWRLVSCWWKPYVDNGVKPIDVFYRNFTAERTINDCYDYRSVIGKLLNKAGVNPQYIISYCLGGTNGYVGARTELKITPRSNVISSYYDTPAQNAPITLAKVLNMLKIVYQCYWYIDNNGNFHIEHISYFDNGYSTTEDEPELLVDLESELHTRTLNNKVYGQNQVKFDKSDMPEQYEFGWADSVTRPFIGYPIKCLDAYVQKGNINEQKSADFDSDIDFCLSSPNDVNKDGFFLFALPAEGADYSHTLKIENVTITDEAGDTYDVAIQNADAAFVKIHKTWWRYHLPCENINVNNEDTVAITTGSYKTQSIEYADLASGAILKNVDDCIKLIRTQQGDGHIKTISINLNSFAAKADLLFNFVGRWYYLRGTALGASITISVNGESVTIDVSNNTFKYRYKEPIAALDFSGTDVVSVNFADCDNLNNLTSANEMFKNCAELLAVDFANKTFGAVTTANDMFAGCSELTTLICPPTASWKADLDFSDCPNLTLESLNDLINDFLYSYDSGTHTITPNSTMWNALDGAVKDDIIARATAKGWTIAIPAQYSISGTSGGNTVYVTINGVALEIDSTGGTWQYDYNTPITSISFENDADVVDIDFSNSDGLAGLTSLANTFKGCNGLTTVDFTNCDLTNITNAADCFSGCGALYSVTIPSGTWKPDVDLSASNSLLYAEMLNFVSGLYTYTSGTHTIIFNSTIWDSMSVADQQTVFNAADAKGWTTNAVAVVFYIRGTSTNVNGTETLNIQFLTDGSVNPHTESIVVNVDANGNFEHSYYGEKIYSLDRLLYSTNQPNITEIEFTEDMNVCTDMTFFCYNNSVITKIAFPNGEFNEIQGLPQTFASTSLVSLDIHKATFKKVTAARYCFATLGVTGELDLSAATFEELVDATRMFDGAKVNSIKWSTDLNFAKVKRQAENVMGMFSYMPNIVEIDLSGQTFAALTEAQYMFRNTKATMILLPDAIFGNVTNPSLMFDNTTSATIIDIRSATFASATTMSYMFYYCKATEINMSAALCGSVGGTTSTFEQNTNLTTLTLTNVATALATTATNLNLRWSPLAYQSMLNLANWVNDFTGYTAPTMTFRSASWNALSTAEQNTIDGILSGKNWNRAIA